MIYRIIHNGIVVKGGMEFPCGHQTFHERHKAERYCVVCRKFYPEPEPVEPPKSVTSLPFLYQG